MSACKFPTAVHSTLDISAIQHAGDDLVLEAHAGATHRRIAMSKGLDKKREEKKKPAKTLEEKRAAKRAKKDNKRFGA
jgi:hypothetical protein